MSTAFAGALAAAAVTMTAETAPAATRNRADVPAEFSWDFSAIYPGWDAGKPACATCRADGRLREAAGHAEERADAVLKAVPGVRRDRQAAVPALPLPQLQRDVDTRDQAVSGRFQRVGALFAKFDVATAWFTPELLTCREATMRHGSRRPGAAPSTASPILDNYRRQAHVLDEKGERLLSLADRLNRAPGDDLPGAVHVGHQVPDRSRPRPASR
jgi:oligoendopeptidase F